MDSGKPKPGTAKPPCRVRRLAALADAQHRLRTAVVDGADELELACGGELRGEALDARAVRRAQLAQVELLLMVVAHEGAQLDLQGGASADDTARQQCTAADNCTAERTITTTPDDDGTMTVAGIERVLTGLS